ncbi:uncharacterized protein LOC141907071 [Tubulanus polymorphus]|uniref:uncharacterized protein LOC141907071 n=1 Tax=Tubulanus polymorphus TaxID=672921 RepID=UPI003DA694EF
MTRVKYWCNLFVLLLTLVDSLLYAEGTCFGSSCSGWLCHCEETVRGRYSTYKKKSCPLQSSDSPLTCPESSTRCDSHSKDGLEWRWKGPGCQIGNVAYSKSVTLSSTGSSWYAPRLCTDGRASNTFCETRQEDNPWLLIDLGSKHVVHYVNIWQKRSISCHAKWNLIQSRVGDRKDVGNALCANYTRVGRCTKKTEKRCDEALVGRYVSVQVLGYDRLRFSEIEVTGFKYIDPNECTYPGSFGCMADARCNLNVPNRVDYLTGYCHGGCSANYMGEFCNKEFVNTTGMEFVSRLNSIIVNVSGIQYTDNVDSGNGRIRVGYRLLYKKWGAKDWIVASTEPPAEPGDDPNKVKPLRQKVVTGLEANTFYEFAVALRKIKANLNSTLLSGGKPTYTLCHEPLVGPQVTGLRQDVSEDTFIVQIERESLGPVQRRCSVPGTMYAVFLSSATKPTWENYGPVIRIRDLKPYTKYRLKVGIKNRGNANFVFGKIREFFTGSAVTQVTATNTSSGAVKIAWNVPEPLQNLRFKFTGRYRLRNFIACPQRRLDTYQKLRDRYPFPTKINELEVFGLKGHAVYEMTVKPVALDESILDREAVTINVTTAATAPEGTPDRPFVMPERLDLDTVKEKTLARVTFHDIPCDKKNGQFTGFHYKLYEKDTGELIQDNVTMREERFILSDLKPFTEYLLSYSWTSRAGESLQSETNQFKTDETILLRVQIKLELAERDGNSDTGFTVEFYHDAIVPGVLLKYALQCGETTSAGVEPGKPTLSYWDVDKSVKKLPIQVDDLKPVTWYGCRASARSKKGWGPASPYVYIQTAPRD